MLISNNITNLQKVVHTHGRNKINLTNTEYVGSGKKHNNLNLSGIVSGNHISSSLLLFPTLTLLGLALVSCSCFLLLFLALVSCSCFLLLRLALALALALVLALLLPPARPSFPPPSSRLRQYDWSYIILFSIRFGLGKEVFF